MAPSSVSSDSEGSSGEEDTGRFKSAVVQVREKAFVFIVGTNYCVLAFLFLCRLVQKKHSPPLHLFLAPPPPSLMPPSPLDHLLPSPESTLPPPHHNCESGGLGNGPTHQTLLRDLGEDAHGLTHLGRWCTVSAGLSAANG